MVDAQNAGNLSLFSLRLANVAVVLVLPRNAVGRDIIVPHDRVYRFLQFSCESPLPAGLSLAPIAPQNLIMAPIKKLTPSLCALRSFRDVVTVLQVLAAMERLDVTVTDVKAGNFKTDDMSGKMQSLLGDASLAQHSLATEQPLGTACLVRNGKSCCVVTIPTLYL